MEIFERSIREVTSIGEARAISGVAITTAKAQFLLQEVSFLNGKVGCSVVGGTLMQQALAVCTPETHRCFGFRKSAPALVVTS